MKNKRFLSTLSILLVTAFMLFGCGNTETEESQATTPEVEIIEQSEETTVVEVETVEEEKISSFAEEKGMVFDIVPEEYFVLHTYNSKDEDEREEQDFDTILTGVNAFESSDSFAGVDGYHYEQGTFIIYKNTPNNGVNFSAYIFDYYTGAVVDLKGLDVSAEITKDQADNAFVVKVGETEYSVTAYSAFEQTDMGWEFTFTALVPNEYDGLCFGIGGIVLEDSTEAKKEKDTLLITDTTYGVIPESWHFYHANELEVTALEEAVQNQETSYEDFGKEIDEYMGNVSDDSVNDKDVQKKAQDIFRELCNEYYAIYEEFSALYDEQNVKNEEIESSLSAMKDRYDFAISQVDSERSMSLEEIRIVKMGMKNDISNMQSLLQ